MKSKWLVVFGPPRPEYNIKEGLKLNDEEVTIFSEYLHKKLKPHFLQFKKKYAYIVKAVHPFLNVNIRTIVDDPKGDFAKYTQEFKGNFKLEIRRIELIDGEFYCTDPYSKNFEKVAKEFPKKGLAALDPN